MSFVHLHVHTEYSVFDGISKTRDLFDRAEKLGMPGLAITDHGVMTGVPDFMGEAARHPSVKPVIGCEVYITDTLDPTRSYHLILLARNRVGYLNLLRIESEAALGGNRTKIRVPHDLVARYHDGLICLSACIGGEIPQRILEDDAEGAVKALMWYREVFGEDFYLEVCEHRPARKDFPTDVFMMQRKVSEAVYALSRDYGVKVVATNDVHMTLRSDARAQEVFLCMSTGKTLCDKDRLRYSGQEYLKSRKEMEKAFPDHPEVLDNTMEVLAKVETFDIRESRPAVPEQLCADRQGSLDDQLRTLAREGLSRRCPESREAAERLERELALVTGTGWSFYFLLIRDLLQQGLRTGPGRGSSASFLLNYVLGITEVNPMEHGLLSERFMSGGRSSLQPVIDIDFGVEDREKAVDYLRRRYGENNVCGVVTHFRRNGALAIRDVFRVYGISEGRTRSVLRKISRHALFRLTDMVSCGDPSFRTISRWYRSAPVLEREAYDVAGRLQGVVFGSGVSTGNVALPSGRVPLMKVWDEQRGAVETVCQYGCCACRDSGALVLQLLSLRVLDVLEEAGQGIDVPFCPSDAGTMEVFSSGDTADVFGFESEGMREMLRELRPETPGHLTDLLSMYRPGPMDFIPEYIGRKNGLRPYNIPLKELEPVLGPTYGLLIYQEQLMQIAQRVSGMSADRSDALRKAASRMKKELLEEMHVEFMEGGLAEGHPEAVLEGIWETITRDGMRLFLKSHAVCYTLLGLGCAYLKAHHRVEFGKAVSEQSQNQNGDTISTMSS